MLLVAVVCTYVLGHILYANVCRRPLAQAFNLVRAFYLPLRRFAAWGNRWETERLTFDSAVIPALTISGVNAYILWNEHWAHWSHMEPLEERTEYSYQNIRTKNFFFGDGDKVRYCISTDSNSNMWLTLKHRLRCK